MHMKLDDDGQWVAVTFVGKVYKILALGTEMHGHEVPVDSDSIKDAEPSVYMPASKLECPSLIISYLPDKDAERYHVVKMISHFHLGLPNQCVVAETVGRQKRLEQ